jgi:osmotically-inducible protein OsmY
MTVAARKMKSALRRSPAQKGKRAGVLAVTESKTSTASVGKRIAYSRAVKVHNPTILLVGQTQRTKKVQRSLRSLAVDIRRETNASRALGNTREPLEAIMLVAPLPKMSLVRACRVFRHHAATHDLPIFVVVGDRAAKKAERKLYKEGATIVFEWPREAPDVPRMVVGVLELELQGHPRKRDGRLLAAIKRRLRVEGNIWGRDLVIVVIDGMAFLTGKVDALWKKRLAVEIISEAPGIRAVFDRGIAVTGKRIDDRRLGAAVRAMVRYAGLRDKANIQVSVSDGVVILGGTVGSFREADRLEDVVSNLEGVRDVVGMLVVSPWLKRRDDAIARSIDSAISSRIAGSSIRVSVFGGICVLKGTAGSAARSRYAEKIAGRQPGVRRIVNKVRVSGPRRSTTGCA